MGIDGERCEGGLKLAVPASLKRWSHNVTGCPARALGLFKRSGAAILNMTLWASRDVNGVKRQKRKRIQGNSA